MAWLLRRCSPRSRPQVRRTFGAYIRLAAGRLLDEAALGDVGRRLARVEAPPALGRGYSKGQGADCSLPLGAAGVPSGSAVGRLWGHLDRLLRRRAEVAAGDYRRADGIIMTRKGVLPQGATCIGKACIQ